jgi:hypothetical protein
VHSIDAVASGRSSAAPPARGSQLLWNHAGERPFLLGQAGAALGGTLPLEGAGEHPESDDREHHGAEGHGHDPVAPPTHRHALDEPATRPCLLTAEGQGPPHAVDRQHLVQAPLTFDPFQAVGAVIELEARSG